MGVFRSPSTLSKLAEILLREKEEWFLGELEATVRDSISEESGR